MEVKKVSNEGKLSRTEERTGNENERKELKAKNEENRKNERKTKNKGKSKEDGAEKTEAAWRDEMGAEEGRAKRDHRRNKKNDLGRGSGKQGRHEHPRDGYRSRIIRPLTLKECL
jgi:flagellar biosynthesis GTPase FlhF